MHLIEYNGKFYVFENALNESENMFIDRCWFIVKNIDRFDYEYLEKLSYLWVTSKHLKCEYSKEIMDILGTCNNVYDPII